MYTPQDDVLPYPTNYSSRLINMSHLLSGESREGQCQYDGAGAYFFDNGKNLFAICAQSNVDREDILRNLQEIGYQLSDKKYDLFATMDVHTARANGYISDIDAKKVRYKPNW